jgi:uncharacterized membrane protein
MYQRISKKEIPDSDVSKYILPFHNFEFTILVIVLSMLYSILIPIAIGVLIHFVIDVSYVRNFKVKHCYSVIYYAISKLS